MRPSSFNLHCKDTIKCFPPRALSAAFSNSSVYSYFKSIYSGKHFIKCDCLLPSEVKSMNKLTRVIKVFVCKSAELNKPVNISEYTALTFWCLSFSVSVSESGMFTEKQHLFNLKQIFYLKEKHMMQHCCRSERDCKRIQDKLGRAERLASVNPI